MNFVSKLMNFVFKMLKLVRCGRANVYAKLGPHGVVSKKAQAEAGKEDEGLNVRHMRSIVPAPPLPWVDKQDYHTAAARITHQNGRDSSKLSAQLQLYKVLLLVVVGWLVGQASNKEDNKAG